MGVGRHVLGVLVSGCVVLGWKCGCVCVLAGFLGWKRKIWLLVYIYIYNNNNDFIHIYLYIIN